MIITKSKFDLDAQINNFDCSVGIKQKPLLLPSSSSSSSPPFVQYHNQSNIKAEAKDLPTIATITSDNKPQTHGLDQYALQQKENERKREEIRRIFKMKSCQIDQQYGNDQNVQIIEYKKEFDLEVHYIELLQQIQDIEELMEQIEQ
ncbi:unnamed protein product [Adineta steineri]|uniref:Uncharacterized protein n=1 Tax=Adineta steineri TaxID=433720 RepID=A0A819FDL2_9BILA|nr:unnamed protein product [Adineta steineri]CAF3864817.1 unnamed protein product [Adineta steineri]